MKRIRSMVVSMIFCESAFYVDEYAERKLRLLAGLEILALLKIEMKQCCGDETDERKILAIAQQIFESEGGDWPAAFPLRLID